MVRALRKKEKPVTTITITTGGSSPPVLEKSKTVKNTAAKRTRRSKYERKNLLKSPIKLTPFSPTIKTYLHVVECMNTPKECNKIGKNGLDDDDDDNVCSNIKNCIGDFYQNKSHANEIITDQPCQITERSPVTPHRIKLEVHSDNNNENGTSVGLGVAQKKRALLTASTNKTIDQLTRSSTIKEYFPVRRSNRKTKTLVLEEKKQSLEGAINSDTETGLEIHYFTDKGRGVVATRQFQRGDFVVEYRGELIDDAEAKQRELLYARDQNTGCYMYYFKHKNRQYCVDATAESKYFGRLINHSRTGNLVTRIEEVGGRPHLVFVAKDNIDSGEEVTYDYGDRSKESLKHHPWLAY